MSRPRAGHQGWERMNRNVERGQATRTQLIEVATGLFATRGYEGTSIEAVLAESGASRGSLYHHFAGKDALFLAVLEDVGTTVTAQVTAAMRDAGDPVTELRAGLLAWIRLAGDPVIRQVMLIDAPIVLGWERWRGLEREERGPRGFIRAALAYAAGQGRLNPAQVDTFAHIVLAAANEVTLLIARADDPAAALRAGESAFNGFLYRMLGPAPA